MIINCPLCGPRDLREFTIRGSADGMMRPGGEEWSDAWHDFIHLRDNPAGVSRELWQHTGGCGAWIVVERNTATHEIISTTLASEYARAS